MENDITVHGYPRCIPFDEFDKRILGRARYELAEDNERLREALRLIATDPLLPTTAPSIVAIANAALSENQRSG
jgi:hypothetical protein